MNRADLIERDKRIEKIAQGLCLEVTLWRTCGGPIREDDRLEYMKQISDAITALEKARFVLEKMLQSMA